MEYLIFDVFAERAFEGNPLAVFPEADDLKTEQMQHIANEMNLSETVFLTKTGNDEKPARVRIFTPVSEMQFAGHPTIGSTVAVADVLQWVPRDRSAFVLEEGVGDVSVRVERNGQTIAWLSTPPIAFGMRISANDAAAILRLAPVRVRGDAPPELAGAGNPFLFIPLVDEASVDAASIDMAEVTRVFGDNASLNGVFLFSLTKDGTYARMLAPMSGVAEDPATGSAHGPLYAYLIKHGLLPNESRPYTALQGVKMGRRSVLHVTVHAGDPPRIDVGGRAILVASGQLMLQPPG